MIVILSSVVTMCRETRNKIIRLLSGSLSGFVRTQKASHPGADLVQAGSDGFCRTVTLEHVTFQHMRVFIPSHVGKIPKKTANRQMLKHSVQFDSSDVSSHHYISTMQELKGLVVNNDEKEYIHIALLDKNETKTAHVQESCVSPDFKF